eukprot:365314-Chlamydomonas_euryale.AAC.11
MYAPEVNGCRIEQQAAYTGKAAEVLVQNELLGSAAYMCECRWCDVWSAAAVHSSIHGGKAVQGVFRGSLTKAAGRRNNKSWSPPKRCVISRRPHHTKAHVLHPFLSPSPKSTGAVPTHPPTAPQPSAGPKSCMQVFIHPCSDFQPSHITYNLPTCAYPQKTPHTHDLPGGSLYATSSLYVTSRWCAPRNAPVNPASVAVICASGGLMCRRSAATSI